MTIPKTYTLRQLRKLGEGWMFVDLDLFLDFLAGQERGEVEGTKVPEMKIDPGKEFKKEIKMSNLDYSIAILSTEKSKLDIWIGQTGERQMERNNLHDGLSRAMKILVDEKRKDEKGRRSPLDKLIEKCEEEDEKAKEKEKKAYVLVDGFKTGKS